MREHSHFSSPESRQDFRVAAGLVATVLVAGIAANILRVLWVLI